MIDKSMKILLIFILIGCGRSNFTVKNSLSGRSHPMCGVVPSRIFYVDENLSDSLNLMWIAETKGSSGLTSITAYGDILFCPDLSGRVYAINVNNGKIFGYNSAKGSVPAACIVNDFKLAYVLLQKEAEYSKIIVYDYFFGKEISSIDIRGNIIAELIRVEDKFIAVSEAGDIFKIDFEGNIIWKKGLETEVRSSPALENNIIVVADLKGNVFGVDFTTGEIIYKKKIDASFLAGVSISGNYIYLCDSKGMVYCLQLFNGELIWSFDAKESIIAFPLVLKERIIIGTLKGYIYCLSASDGVEIWKNETKGIIAAAGLAFQDYLVQPDLNKRILFIDLDDGTLKSTFNFENRVKLTPIFYNKFLIIGVDDGKIMAYKRVINN